MTDAMMNLRALVEKSPDADLLREMIGFAAHRLMELEVETLTGAPYGEKNPDRLARKDRVSSLSRSIGFPSAPQASFLQALEDGQGVALSRRWMDRKECLLLTQTALAVRQDWKLNELGYRSRTRAPNGGLAQPSDPQRPFV
jgi:hypothetical protein